MRSRPRILRYVTTAIVWAGLVAMFMGILAKPGPIDTWHLVQLGALGAWIYIGLAWWRNAELWQSSAESWKKAAEDWRAVASCWAEAAGGAPADTQDH